jgi:hypothetical protein
MLNAAKRRIRLLNIVMTALLATSCAAARELTQIEPISFSSGTIAGAVTDSLTQQPIVGAAITLLTASGDSIPDQQSRAFSFAPGGTYRFDSVRPGSYLLRAKADGYDSVTISISQLDAGQRLTVMFKLRR